MQEPMMGFPRQFIFCVKWLLGLASSFSCPLYIVQGVKRCEYCVALFESLKILCRMYMYIAQRTLQIFIHKRTKWFVHKSCRIQRVCCMTCRVHVYIHYVHWLRELGLKHRLHLQWRESMNTTKGFMYARHTLQRTMVLGWITGHSCKIYINIFIYI